MHRTAAHRSIRRVGALAAAVLTFSAPGAAFAQSGDAGAEDALVAPYDYAPGRVLSAIEADLDGDGAIDSARLVVGQDVDADLVVSFGDAERPPLTVLGLAWRGGMFGTQPELAVTPQGSLQVTAMNSAIGRWRWEETLTVAWRDEAFYVAGYTFSGYDTIELYSVSCDVNLFTGNGVRDDAPFETAPRRVRLAAWTEDAKPAECAPDQ